MPFGRTPQKSVTQFSDKPALSSSRRTETLPRRRSRTNRRQQTAPTGRSAGRVFKQVKGIAQQVNRADRTSRFLSRPHWSRRHRGTVEISLVEWRSLPGLFLLPLPMSAGFFASSAFFVGAAGLNAVGCCWISGMVLAPAGRGHEKSSPRPAGAAKASPRLKTFAAIWSDVSA